MDDVLIECSPGISGDMLLGAFYDLGVPKKVIEQPLIDLGLKDLYKLEFKESKSYSIRGIKAKVKNIECSPCKRTWRSIKELILNGHLEDKLKNIFIYLICISIILEILHLIIPERGFELGDLFGNIIGVFISFLIFKIIYKGRLQ